jgi:transcriptional regulator
MYIPRIYRNDNISEIVSFIRENGFAQFISIVDNVPFVTHIPVMYRCENGEHILHGHIARGNPQWRKMQGEQLIVFLGPHTYVSSSWYDHTNVPTWNYIAVHAYGPVRIIDNDELYLSLKALTNHYEAGQEHPVRVDGMSDYVRMQMKGIVGFEMKVSRLEGKWKMSQNRDEKNYKAIIAELEKINQPEALAVAEIMKGNELNSGE